jgi:hypothetical protein
MKDTVKTKKYPVITTPLRGRILIPGGVKRKIDQLHRSIGNVEWAGFITYEKTAGSMSVPNELVLKVLDIYPMSIGTHSYVEADNHADDMLDLCDRVPSFMGSRYGLVHTHHTMNTFFSGTDIDELHDNVDKYSSYLSLIVNMKDEYTAKIVSLVDVSPRMVSIKEEDEETRSVQIGDDTVQMLMVDLDVSIEKEHEDDPVISLRIEELRKRNREKETDSQRSVSPTSGTVRTSSPPVQTRFPFDTFDMPMTHHYSVNRFNAEVYLKRLLSLDDTVGNVDLYSLLLEEARDANDYPDYIDIYYGEIAEECYNMAIKMVGGEKADELIKLAVERLSDYEKDPNVSPVVANVKLIMSSILNVPSL